LLKEFSGLKVVFDHCLNLKAGPEFPAVLADVIQLSRHKNLHAKLTFLPTGSTTGYPSADMHEADLKIIDAFGSERCVWGSDLNFGRKRELCGHMKIFAEALPLKGSARTQILGEKARRLWFPGLVL
jgi:L-fuconolactonase